MMGSVGFSSNHTRVPEMEAYSASQRAVVKDSVASSPGQLAVSTYYLAFYGLGLSLTMWQVPLVSLGMLEMASRRVSTVPSIKRQGSVFWRPKKQKWSI